MQTVSRRATTSCSKKVASLQAWRAIAGTSQPSRTLAVLSHTPSSASLSAAVAPSSSPTTASPTRLPGSRRHRSTLSQQPHYAGHVPINGFQRGLLAVGSAFASLLNPYRHDMVAVLGETTSGRQLPKMREALLKGDEEGRRILVERPRITSTSIDLGKLRALQEGTFGRAYVDWLDNCGVSPDTRDPVRYIDDPELAYIMQRYRECHDFYHVVLGFPVNVSAELVVKWFELANMGLPVALLSSVFGPLRVKSDRRRRLVSTYLSWALRCGSQAKPLIGIRWEERWEMKMDDLRRELGIAEPPMTWQEYKESSPFRKPRT